MTLPLAVMASGGGTNLQALLDHEGVARRRGGDAPLWRVALVVSDRQGSGALERAGRAGREGRVVPAAGRAPEEVAADLLGACRDAGIEAVVLAGYMRLVPEAVVEAYRNRILNVHPALLPAFGGQGMYGRHVHQAVLERGGRVTGVTVHLVDERYDRGPILAQWPVPVRPGDTPERLEARVRRVEHRLYPRVVDHVARALEAGADPTGIHPAGEAFRAVDDDDADSGPAEPGAEALEEP